MKIRPRDCGHSKRAAVTGSITIARVNDVELLAEERCLDCGTLFGMVDAKLLRGELGVRIMDDEERARIFEEGRKAGKEYEMALWFWQARDLPAMVTMGWPAARPERPKNPYLKRANDDQEHH